MKNKTLDELISIVEEVTTIGKAGTAIPRVAVVKGSIPEHQLSGVYEPMINLVIQGHKRLNIGDKVLHYSPANYFVMSVDLPATGEIFPDSNTGEPYMAIALTINSSAIREILDTTKISKQRLANVGFGVGDMNNQLLDAWCRLLKLTKTPNSIAVLAPLYEKELLYLTLLGSQGALLRDIALNGTTLQQVHLAIEWLRIHFRSAVKVSDLANIAGMSEATFFRKFRSVTALSPIQYQKQMRLLEARRLLVETDINAGAASYEVGYESQSQFTRDYSSFFGKSPSRDVRYLKEMVNFI